MEAITVVNVQANIQWQVSRSPEGNWIAVCQPLHISMEGSTLEELEANIGDSLQLLLADLLAENELERFLQAHGWRLNTQPPKPNEKVEFAVPFELLVRSSRDPARAVH